MSKKENWLIADLWNTSLSIERKDTKTRDYITAGDLGSPFLDRYYKMKGIKPSNDYDERTLRVFATGNEFHHLIYKVFEKIGILIDKEFYCEIPATEDTLRVLGFADAKVGGFSDWNEAKQRVKQYGFSEAIETIALKIIDRISTEYPDGLDERIIDVKSINSNAFWYKKGYIGSGYPHHKLQLYTYLKALNIKTGALMYISKDDLSLEECIVLNPSVSLEEKWQEDIKQMSYYYKKDIVPPKEPDIIFNENRKRWETNWKMGRSPYLTHITGLSRRLGKKNKRGGKSKK
jgi:hypothetical protein